MKTETSNSVWSVTFSNKFLYDGWNLLAELNGTNGNLISSYTWGPDISGGVGRLVSILPSGAAANFVAYDGSGNIVALIDGSLGTISARQSYQPFGRLIRATGPMADAAHFGFSTTYFDPETSFSYYGYRSYNSVSGRWLSRDPVGQRGGLNCYGFANNTPLNAADRLGLELIWLPEVYDTIANINQIYRDPNASGTAYAWTGDPDFKINTVAPVRTREDDTDVIMTSNEEKCAVVRHAREMDVRVQTVLPSDWYTRFLLSGFMGVMDVEQARRDVYHDAYYAYIDPVVADGSRAVRCGMICRCEPGIAERLLRRYLGYNQALGHYLYDRYVQRWQEKIGQSETEKRDLTTGLYDDVYLYDRELLRFLVIPPPPLFYDTTETLCPPPSDGQTW